MGSFANSVHVRSNNAASVADAIRELLRTEGYEATDEGPARSDKPGLPSQRRALHVSEARDSWVSVLDSDLMGCSLSLAEALSGRLGTHALQVMVNDSDSWHYQLYHAGQALDEFDSAGGEDGEDEEDHEALAGLTGAFAGANAAEVQRVLLDRARQMQQQLQQRMPPELREAQWKWMQTGQITPEQMQEFNQWMRGNAEPAGPTPRLAGRPVHCPRRADGRLGRSPRTR